MSSSTIPADEPGSRAEGDSYSGGNSHSGGDSYSGGGSRFEGTPGGTPSDDPSPPDPAPRGPRFVDKLGVRWRVRPADARDREDLVATYRAFDAADRAQGLPPATESRIRDWLDRLLADGWNVLAEGTSGVVGHAALVPDDAPEPELAVFVRPDYHDRGIGTELCRHVLARAAATDREAVVLDVERRNRAALAVYRRLGFEPVESGRGELRMRLPVGDRLVSEG